MPIRGKQKPWDLLPLEEPSEEDRQQLRYPHLMRDGIPDEYMHIDEAIDEIGQRKFPGYWGFQPNFHNLPFDGRFRRVDFRKNGNGHWKRMTFAVKYMDAKEPGLSHLQKHFVMSAYQLLRGIESGKLHLHTTSTTHGIMPAVNVGVASKQRRTVIYTGRVRSPESPRGSLPFIAVLQRAQFFEWVDRSELSVSRPVPRKSLEDIVGAVKAHLELIAVPTTSAALMKTVATTLGQSELLITQNDFQQNIWLKLPAKNRAKGRPATSHAEKWKASEPELIEAIRAIALER